MSIKTQTIALDVYGTLINTSSVLTLLEKMAKDKASALSDLWRSKQLEYSFRRGLMNRYVDFSIVTKEALEYCCQVLDINLSAANKEELMQQYRKLPSFEDAKEGTQQLKKAGHQVFAFSNGSRKAVTELLEQAEILNLLDGIVSMEEVQTFKPNPVGYRHFCQSTTTSPENAWLVSSNNFDVIGAKSFGMQSAWLRRNDKNIFDPMGYAPTITIHRLTDLVGAVENYFNQKNA